MNIETACELMETWRSTVIKKPISKDMSGHIIEGLGVNDPLEKSGYEVFVIGQNLNHRLNFVTKPLQQWLSDNGYA